MPRKWVNGKNKWTVKDAAMFHSWQAMQLGRAVLLEPDKEPANRYERRLKKSFERGKK
jgi:hypothetical protein